MVLSSLSRTYDGDLEHGVLSVADSREKSRFSTSVYSYYGPSWKKTVWDRPALKTEFRIDPYKNGDIEIFYNFPFIHISTNLWIAGLPLTEYNDNSIHNGLTCWKLKRHSIPQDCFKNNSFISEHNDYIQRFYTSN